MPIIPIIVGVLFIGLGIVIGINTKTAVTVVEAIDNIIDNIAETIDMTRL